MNSEIGGSNEATDKAFESIIGAEFSYLEDFTFLDPAALDTVNKLEAKGYTKEDIVAMFGLEGGASDEI